MSRKYFKIFHVTSKPDFWNHFGLVSKYFLIILVEHNLLGYYVHYQNHSKEVVVKINLQENICCFFCPAFLFIFATVNIISPCPINIISPCPRNIISPCPRNIISSCPRNIISSCPRNIISSCPINIISPCPINIISSCPRNIIYTLRM